jgi:phosphoribosylformylglycinamidine (FGAM) synthase-like enzyme
VKALIRMNLVASAHDISEGGLFTCLLESAITSGKGFNIETDESIRKDAYLFGESQSRIVVTVPANKENNFINFMLKSDAEFSLLGEVKGLQITVDNEKWGLVDNWKKVYDNALEQLLNQ